MGKHAYLIIAHNNLRLLEVCLKMIDDSQNDIFLLFDKKANVSNQQKQYFLSIVKGSNLHILEDMTINWAGASQIWAILELIKISNNSSVEYDYVHFFQGADLPIKTQNEIHAFFEKNKGIEFVRFYPEQKKMAQRKARYRHFFVDNKKYRNNKIVKLLNFAVVWFQKIFFIRRNLDIELYQGSALFSITGECAKFIESKEDEIKQRFKNSLACDEVFLPSILMKSEFKEKINKFEGTIVQNARLIDRIRRDGRNAPHIWRISDWEEIISQPEAICFARKFNENVDFEIVKKLYKKIMGEDFSEGVR